MTAPTPRVRDAAPADLGVLERLLGDFCAETGWPRRPVHEATRAAWTAGRAPGFRAFLAEDAAPVAAPLGFATTFLTWDLGDGPGAWLSDLYVVPSARRRGVGRALVAAAARAALGDGATFVAWHADRTNEAARRFYAALGAGERPSHLLTSLDRAALETLARTAG